MARARRTLLWIHAYVAFQLVMPAGYYCWRRDTNDERFAWRMFSSVRMARCGSGPDLRAPPELAVGADKRPINLRETFHTAWIELAQRGRVEVIEAMVARVCGDRPGEPVFVRYDCRQIDGTIRPGSSGGWDVCRTGRL
jgi:hypothetical protein